MYQPESMAAVRRSVVAASACSCAVESETIHLTGFSAPARLSELHAKRAVIVMQTVRIGRVIASNIPEDTARSNGRIVWPDFGRSHHRRRETIGRFLTGKRQMPECFRGTRGVR